MSDFRAEIPSGLLDGDCSFVDVSLFLECPDKWSPSNWDIERTSTDILAGIEPGSFKFGSGDPESVVKAESLVLSNWDRPRHSVGEVSSLGVI